MYTHVYKIYFPYLHAQMAYMCNTALHLLLALSLPESTSWSNVFQLNPWNQACEMTAHQVAMLVTVVLLILVQLEPFVFYRMKRTRSSWRMCGWTRSGTTCFWLGTPRTMRVCRCSVFHATRSGCQILCSTTSRWNCLPCWFCFNLSLSKASLAISVYRIVPLETLSR